MNTRKTVYSKLFTEKVELEKHEVDLSLAEDIKKAISATLAFKDQRKAAWNKASTPLIGLYDILRIELQTASKAADGIKLLKEKTAALGVEIPAKVLENEKTVMDIIKTSKAKVDKLNKIINEIPNLVL